MQDLLLQSLYKISKLTSDPEHPSGTGHDISHFKNTMMSLCARCPLSVIHRSSLASLSKCRFASQLSSDERTQALSKLSQGPFPWETVRIF